LEQNPALESQEEMEARLKEVEERLSGNRRSLLHTWNWIAVTIAAATGLYHLYVAYFGPPFALLFRNIHWMLVASILFLVYSSRARASKHRPEVVDLLLVGLSVTLGLYVWLNWTAIAARAGAPTTTDIVLGILLVGCVIEACRRTVGWPIIIVALAFLAYAYFGQAMPGLLKHKGYSISRIFPYLYLTDAGVFGIPLGVSAKFIMLFIIFGAFLDRSGAAVFFRDLSFALTGRFTGGPAKAAVVFSGFMGSISGSSTANVVTTGTFTIPLMKRMGYHPAFAGGVEAAASTGGQILPPVMGAVAFVMAEWLNVRYVDVMKVAIVPAILYFVAIYFMVHYRSLREGLTGLPREELPKVWSVLRSGWYYSTPLLLLVGTLVMGFSPSRAVLYAICTTIPLSWARKETRMGLKDIYLCLATGSIRSLEVAAACAAAGIVIGVVTMTGLGLKFSTLIIEISQGHLWIALPLTMLSSLILGMGVPTTAKYIIIATLVAPAIVELGAPLMAAHMFILFFGTDADITPPVGLASYAAAGLAGANPMRTGWEAFKLGLSAYLVPFLFVYHPALILEAPLREILVAVPTAILGIVALSASIQGYYMSVLTPWRRILLAGAALALIDANVLVDFLGIAVIAGITVQEHLRRRRAMPA
jgi:TRAP transporter 4TM/12TM fusion protein